MDRYKLVEVIVKRGFREPDPATRASVQAYTARLLGRALDVTPESIRHVELRQLTWSTQPMKLPPMDRDDVKGERSVGGFKLGEARGS